MLLRILIDKQTCRAVTKNQHSVYRVHGDKINVPPSILIETYTQKEIWTLFFIFRHILNMCQE